MHAPTIHPSANPAPAGARRHWALRPGVLAFALTAAVISGCAVYATPQPVVTGGIADPMYVQSVPPAPIQEAVTIQPALGMVWMPGFWFWGGHSYSWRAGHWAHPPAGYSRWAPGRWHGTPRGHVWRQGGWRR